MSLTSKAMLAQLTIRRWLGQKFDREATQDLESAKNARGAGRYNKQLIDKVHLKKISSIASEVRAYHYKVTLPWGDNGDRLLPSKLFLEYSQKIRSFKADYETAVQEFVQAYPTIINSTEQHTRLGLLFNPEDYPPQNQLVELFSIDLNFIPVPDAKDFRVDLGAEQIEKIRKEITALSNTRQEQAQEELKTRMKEVVSKIHERLSDPKAIFRDSLIENAETLCSLIPSLNITDDPTLNSLVKIIEDKLIHPPQTIRDNLTLRKEVADEAKKLLKLL